MPDGDVYAAMMAEYACKYCTKKDNVIMNARLLEAIMDMLDEKDCQQKFAKQLLAKMLNTINGSITLPLVMVTGFLLGRDDHWFPMHTTPFDVRWHQNNIMKREKVSIKPN